MSWGLGKNLRCDKPPGLGTDVRMEIEDNGGILAEGWAGYGIYIKLSRGGGAERG